jgi:hypothetical protein
MSGLALQGPRVIPDPRNGVDPGKHLWLDPKSDWVLRLRELHEHSIGFQPNLQKSNLKVNQWFNVFERMHLIRLGVQSELMAAAVILCPTVKSPKSQPF